MTPDYMPDIGEDYRRCAPPNVRQKSKGLRGDAASRRHEVTSRICAPRAFSDRESFLR
jgi:hypothetical protein